MPEKMEPARLLAYGHRGAWWGPIQVLGFYCCFGCRTRPGTGASSTIRTARARTCAENSLVVVLLRAPSISGVGAFWTCFGKVENSPLGHREAFAWQAAAPVRERFQGRGHAPDRDQRSHAEGDPEDARDCFHQRRTSMRFRLIDTAKEECPVQRLCNLRLPSADQAVASWAASCPSPKARPGIEASSAFV